jgi:hypothetical protein
MTTVAVEPSGFRHDYIPPGRASASIVLLPGLFAGD